MTVKLVRASGDTTGATDHAAIQAQLDDTTVDTVVLDGTYYIDDTLTVPPKMLTGVTMPLSTAWPSSVSRATAIYYAGAADATKYALDVQGGVLSHLQIHPQSNCRGVKFTGCKYLAYVTDAVRIMLPTVVGADFIDCYGSEIRGLTVYEARGISLRMHRCNSCLVSNARISHAQLFRNSDSDQNTTTWTTACTDGQAAAEALEGYTTDWPDVDETGVTNITDDYVRTAATERAAIVIAQSDERQDLTVFDNLVMEQMKCGEYPVMSALASTCQFRNLRLEGGYYAGAVLKVRKSGASSVRVPAQFLLDNIDVQMTTYKPKYVIHAVDGSRHCVVRQASIQEYVTDAIIACDGGAHYGPRVDGHVITLSSVPDVLALNGATITGTETVHGSDGAIYLGDYRSNDSWRIARSGDDLVFERREAGSWVQKSITQAIEL